MNSFVQTFKNLGPARLAAIGAVTLGLLAFFVFIITRLSTPSLAVLYSDLDLSESGEIASRLESMKVEYELKEDGAQILVPQDQVTRLRMTLAQEGLPTGGSMGYELLDNSEGLGSSAFMQNINRVRALEGELARTIGSLQDVKSARVHLVLPQRELFSRESREPSASIVLKMKGAARLSKQQIAAVQNLVAGAVPGLNATQVSIIDDQGTLLARGVSGADSGSLLADSAAERQQAYEARLIQQIEDLLSQTVGVGKVRASVRADMDFDRVRENSEIYDPASQVVRSTQTVEEKSDEVDRSGSNAVTVQGNIPEALGEPITGSSDQNVGSFSNQNRTEETVNYEISKTIREQIRETGIVKRLSVAVLVDGRYVADEAAEGALKYEPRSQEELDKLEAVIKSTVGFDEERGDVIKVANLQFVDTLSSVEDTKEVLLGLDEAAVARIAEMLILSVAGILALLLIVRPLLTRLLESSGAGGGLAALGPEGQFLAESQLSGAGRITPALTGPTGSALPAGATAGGQPAIAGQSRQLEVPENNELEEMINISQIEGKIKASSIKKVGEIIEKHPDEATGVIRNWLYEDSSQSS